jgi:biopolymer transport protein ExbD
MRNLVLIWALALPTLAQSPTPQSAGAAQPVVTITRTGVLALDGRPVEILQLNASIERRSNAERDVIFRPEKDVPFNLVLQVLSELQSATPPFIVKLEPKNKPNLPIPDGLKGSNAPR